MGGLGTCPCCKEWKDLTEHHDKELKDLTEHHDKELKVKVMICRDCHDIIEEYIKVQAKCSKIKSKK